VVSIKNQHRIIINYPSFILTLQIDRSRAVAFYVAGIGEGDDKVLMKWTAGYQMDDFYGALKEIEAV